MPPHGLFRLRKILLHYYLLSPHTIAFEMRYTVLTTGGVQTFLHSIARGIGCFWAMLVATNKQRTYRKQNTMKKTLIALLALAGVSAAWENSYTNTVFELDGTTTKNDRLIFDGANGSAITVTTTNDVVIGEINANSSGSITSVTFNLSGTFTIDGGQSLFGKGDNLSTTLNLGENGKFEVLNNSFSTGKNTSLTLSAVLKKGETDRVLVDATSSERFINAGSITLNISSADNYTNGGLVYEYEGSYFSSSDVTNNSGRLTIADGADALTLASDTLYTVVSAYDLETGGKPVFNKISLLVVPEPTTATLSLLALAGLAARRRRK